MSFLNGPSDRGFTQIHILPVHTLNRKGKSLTVSSKYKAINYYFYYMLSASIKKRKCHVSFIHILSSLYYQLKLKLLWSMPSVHGSPYFH